MTGTTVNGIRTAGITFSNAAYNPVYVSPAASVTAPTGSALYGAGSVTWTMTNAGTLAASSAGIELRAGGTATNSGIIAGLFGIEFDKVNTAGSAINSGSISATSTGVIAYYAASVTNRAGGSIIGFDGVYGGGGFNGGGALDVTNAGTIGGIALNTNGNGAGIYLRAGGSVTNQLGGLITATGSAYMESAVIATSKPVNVVNAGTIAASRNITTSAREHYHTANGVFFQEPGGTLINQAGATITAGSTNSYTHGYAVVSKGVATITNAGTITANFKGGGVGISLASGGVITNMAGALIANDGFNQSTVLIGLANPINAIVNAGTITGGSYAAAIRVKAATNIANLAGGVLSGSYGVIANYTVAAIGSITNAGTFTGRKGFVISGHTGTVVNQAGGTIAATGSGVLMSAGGTVINAAGASISGGSGGVAFYGAAGTVINAGTISSPGSNSGSGHVGAVILTAGFANRVVLNAGGSFTGTVDGGNTLGATIASTLELAPGTGNGRIAGLGTQFTDFAAITIDPGVKFLIGGNGAGFGSTITGFANGDTLDLTGAVETGKSYAAGVLTLTGATTQQINLPGSFATANFTLVPDGSGGTFVTVACYAAGSLIRTEHGEVPVEDLQPGDRVHSAFGGTVPVVWIGHRRIDCNRHPNPDAVRPIRVRADAFAPGQPHRDLLLSPDHCIFADGALIPVATLLNGVSIVQTDLATVDYHHVELPTHDVLLANDLAAESYLDTGNRHAFANGGPVVALAADFATRIWDAEACAPQLTHGPRHARLAARLALRAAEQDAATSPNRRATG